MSKAHEIYGAAAQFYENGGNWVQRAGYGPDGAVCLGACLSALNTAMGIQDSGKRWMEINHLMKRQVGVGIVEFNDHTETTKEKVINTCWDIAMSAELE